jgi:hypothetical protein
VLVEWARSMLEIRERPAGTLRKAMSAISATKKRRVLWPLLDRLWKGMKSQGWAVKLSAAMMAIVAVCMPDPGAGIAAFGGAIGVPLWVVFGAGGAFAGAIVDAGAAARAQRRRKACRRALAEQPHGR